MSDDQIADTGRMSDEERVWTYHRYTPDAEGERCLCGHPKDHPSHGEPPELNDGDRRG